MSKTGRDLGGHCRPIPCLGEDWLEVGRTAVQTRQERSSDLAGHCAENTPQTRQADGLVGGHGGHHLAPESVRLGPLDGKAVQVQKTRGVPKPGSGSTCNVVGLEHDPDLTSIVTLSWQQPSSGGHGGPTSKPPTRLAGLRRKSTPHGGPGRGLED
jgi:hypothetical protein